MYPVLCDSADVSCRELDLDHVSPLFTVPSVRKSRPDRPAGQEQLLFGVLDAVTVPPKSLPLQELPNEQLGEAEYVFANGRIVRHASSVQAHWPSTLLIHLAPAGSAKRNERNRIPVLR